MTKTQYRSELAIMHDIMSVTAYEGQSGIRVSRISHKANLSHYVVVEKCQRLIDAGLIELNQNKRNRIYNLTEKGITFYNELTRFQSLVSSLNLRC